MAQFDARTPVRPVETVVVFGDDPQVRLWYALGLDVEYRHIKNRCEWIPCSERNFVNWYQLHSTSKNLRYVLTNYEWRLKPR